MSKGIPFIENPKETEPIAKEKEDEKGGEDLKGKTRQIGSHLDDGIQNLVTSHRNRKSGLKQPQIKGGLGRAP